MTRIAIYPGSFDPPTRGHEDLIRRSLALADRLIVAVAVNAAKQPLFSVEERLSMLRVMCEGEPRIAIEAPVGYDLQIRPRSGLGRRGVDLVFGTLDSDYRGEVFVSMRTFGSTTSFRIQHGDRIAQLVVARVVDVRLEQVEELSDSVRGDGGHGSTGR